MHLLLGFHAHATKLLAEFQVQVVERRELPQCIHLRCSPDCQLQRLERWRQVDDVADARMKFGQQPKVEGLKVLRCAAKLDGVCEPTEQPVVQKPANASRPVLYCGAS